MWSVFCFYIFCYRVYKGSEEWGELDLDFGFEWGVVEVFGESDFLKSVVARLWAFLYFEKTNRGKIKKRGGESKNLYLKKCPRK